MLDLDLDLAYLQQKKNLLAFSAGVDSSALFFLLIENHIKFDIAIVDYGVREQSKEELAHAKALARKHKLFCHSITAPKFHANFEQQARDFRYGYFDSLVAIEGYDNLLTAHQLNDQLEWMLMRFTKGAGVSELIGLEARSQRKNYTLLRPLLSFPKAALVNYLESHDHPYFVDESNQNEVYERNKFRHQFSDALLAEYQAGITRSFEYLRKDKAILASTFEIVYQHKAFRILKLSQRSVKAKASDVTLKGLGYLLSAAQRREIEKEDSLVIGGEWVVALVDHLLYIAPYVTEEMPKAFKEVCRVEKIPSKVRPYLYKENIALENFLD